MKNRFSIGQMAKLHNTSVKTLRYYDEIDLFKPFEVDPQTGYRYYAVEQFKLLDIINYLRTLGVPLKDIKRQISSRDLNDFIHTLMTHKKNTEEKIRELEIVQKKLDSRIQEIESVKTITQIGEPFVKKVEERTIIQMEETILSLYDLELALRKLNIQFKDFATIFIGKVGLTLSIERFHKNHFFEYDSIFLLLEEVEKGKVDQKVGHVSVLPAGDFACVYVQGGHEMTPVYTERLYDFVQKQGFEITGDFIIRTVVDQFISDNKAEHIMEIQLPVTM